MPLSRRKLLELLSLSVPLVTVPVNRLRARAGQSKFLLYIHFGSADGLTSGMLQPREVVIDGLDKQLKVRGRWQEDLFWDSHSLVLPTSQYNGLVNANLSINPNVNVHYQDSDSALIFNEYSKVLHPIREHLCLTCGNSRSLSHHDAAAFQITGGRFSSKLGSWVANFAQALCGDDKYANIVVAPSFSSVRENIYTEIFNRKGKDNDKVAIINANSIAELYDVLTDAAGIPEAKGDAPKFWQIAQGLRGAGGAQYRAIKDSVGYYVDNLLAGAPELSPHSPLRTNIEQHFTAAALNNILNDSSLPGGNVCDVDRDAGEQDLTAKLIAELQLAAALAGSQRAKGMLMSWGDHDYHRYGSSLTTPRHAALLFAAVNLFWQWVKTQQLQDDVLVVISHDFSRTPYNSREQIYKNETDKPIITARTAAGAVQEHRIIPVGNDHQTVMSMMFINGRVPAAGRVGALSDNYLAFGSNDARGQPDLSRAPYTSAELIGTMLMRCFSDAFPDVATLRRFFPQFTKPIKWLRD